MTSRSRGNDICDRLSTLVASTSRKRKDLKGNESAGLESRNQKCVKLDAELDVFPADKNTEYNCIEDENDREVTVEDLEKEEDGNYKIVTNPNNESLEELVGQYFYLTKGLSEKTMQTLDDYVEVLSGVRPKISSSVCIKKLDDLYSTLLPESTEYCPECTTKLQYSQCLNINCSFYQSTWKRCSSQSPITVTTLSIRKLLDHLLSWHFESFFKVHQAIHYKTDADLADIHKGQFFQSSIETKDEFLNLSMSPILSCSFDAFIISRTSRSSNLPLYLRVESLEKNERENTDNVLLCGFIQSYGKAKRDVMEKLFARLKVELYDVCTNGININWKGDVWSIKPKLILGFADINGIRDLYSCPNYSASHGCHLCIGEATKRGRITLHENIGEPRTAYSCRVDAKFLRRGFSYNSTCLDLITPCNFLVDELHCLCEGIFKSIMKDFMNIGNEWPCRRLSPSARRLLDDVSKKTINYTYSKKFLISAMDISTATGAEIRQMALLLIPLVASECLLKNNLAALHCLGIVVLYMRMGRSDLESLGFALARIHQVLMVPNFTLKCHLAYFHMADHAFKYGRSTITTEYFERCHNIFQIDLNKRATNVGDMAIKRFVITPIIKRRFEQYVEDHNCDLPPNILPHDDKANSLKDGIAFANGFVPKRSLFDENELIPSDLQLLNEICSSQNRMIARRIVSNKQMFSSSVYWRNNKRSDSSLICYQCSHRLQYGRIRFIIIVDNSVTIVIEHCLTYTIDETYGKLENSLHEVWDSDIEEVWSNIGRCEYLPVKYRSSTCMELISPAQIVSPALYLPFVDIFAPIDIPIRNL